MMNFLCIYYATVFKAILLAMSAYLLSLFSWKKITTEKKDIYIYENTCKDNMTKAHNFTV